MTTPFEKLIDDCARCSRCGKPASARCHCWDDVFLKCHFRGCRNKAVCVGFIIGIDPQWTVKVCEVHKSESDFRFAHDL